MDIKNIPESQNFCRVFELPVKYPTDFCFGGGHLVEFKMVDWFNPIPNFELMPEYKDKMKTWDDVKKFLLDDFLLEKNYVKQNALYLLITDFGESFIFQKTFSIPVNGS